VSGPIRSGRELTGVCRGINFPAIHWPIKETAMKWKTPRIIEIAVGLEINAYACAEVK
jgi:coenzyme PQQ precursor peptide PqqA